MLPDPISQFFSDQVFSGLGPICNRGVQAGQPCLSTWYMNGVLTPGHIHCLVSRTRSKAELLNGLPNMYHHIVLKVVLYIFRMEFSTLSVTSSLAQIYLAATSTREPIF